MLKTEAVRRNIAYMCQDNDIGYVVHRHDERFPAYSPICTTPVLIVTVDDLPTRERIWNLLCAERAAFEETGTEHPVELLIDARSGRNYVTVYAVDLAAPNPDTSIYDASFTRGSADIPCSERSVAYNSASCAGIVGGIVAAKARGGRIPRRVTVDHESFTYLVQ